MIVIARRNAVVVGTVLLIIATVLLATEKGRSLTSSMRTRLRGGFSVEDRLAQYGPSVDGRLRARFGDAGLPYPPSELSYVVFKDARRLEIYSRESSEKPWVFVVDYPVIGASGHLGPKLAQGDNQVPEGIYHADFLNPNSRFHLSIRLNYPNPFDQEMARADGRSHLGGDIMIHGGLSSIGCLAMGDAAAEDLFVLAAMVTKDRLRIIISPTDFRESSVNAFTVSVPWINTLYSSLRAELGHYRKQR